MTKPEKESLSVCEMEHLATDVAKIVLWKARKDPDWASKVEGLYELASRELKKRDLQPEGSRTEFLNFSGDPPTFVRLWATEIHDPPSPIVSGVAVFR